MTPIRTKRLILREPTLDDAPSYALGVGEYDVAQFLTAVPYPYTLGMAIDWLRQARPATPEKSLLIIDLPGKGLIGCISLLNELGFWLARPHWNRGYMTEAATALLDWHFDGCAADAVTSSAHYNNAASLAVQHKLGFVSTGREMRFSQAQQNNVDHVVSRLSRTDWQTRVRR
ncbi:Protein N-acetyltransferase, RimJ/RimL family [Devosia sp. YR412]|uniref:GNAT family N-acetyltransferase n=1 Tax=Devosia sp. YR412 TaxID=1881030 RepID=UPI0008BBA37E|nr:GNAT family N-acetyltransferase [Devosia sp. YR412]SEQ26463.1 Protein N-acetyltransferase, RimJ/RimL family [Devosia sp. YR412]